MHYLIGGMVGLVVGVVVVYIFSSSIATELTKLRTELLAEVKKLSGGRL